MDTHFLMSKVIYIYSRNLITSSYFNLCHFLLCVLSSCCASCFLQCGQTHLSSHERRQSGNAARIHVDASIPWHAYLKLWPVDSQSHKNLWFRNGWLVSSSSGGDGIGTNLCSAACKLEMRARRRLWLNYMPSKAFLCRFATPVEHVHLHKALPLLTLSACQGTKHAGRTGRHVCLLQCLDQHFFYLCPYPFH